MKMKEKMGDFALDIAKLTFGGLILSSIVSEPINRWVVYSLGILFLLFAMILGFALIDNSNN